MTEDFDEVPEGEHGRFYKYRSFNERTDQIIQNRELFFASPIELNDPFEMKPYVVWPDADEAEQLREIVWQGFRDRYPPYVYGSNRIDALTRDRLEKLEQSDADRNIQLWQIADSTTGICSLSRNCHSILQWSYYADEHRGLCLEFTKTVDTDFTQFWPVRYAEDRPAIHILDLLSGDPKQEQFRALTTKSAAWQHEDEVRLLSMERGTMAFPQEMLTAVYFGLAVDEHRRKAFCQLLVEYDYPDVPVYQMSMKLDKFEIESISKGTAKSFVESN